MGTKDQLGSYRVFLYVAFLVALSVVNVGFFYSSRWRPPGLCTTDGMLQAISLYLAHNGEFELDHFLPVQCPQVSQRMKSELAESVTKLADDCLTVKWATKAETTRPLVTLFTTHALHTHEDLEKYKVHNNTLINWANLKKVANLILFTNDSSWANLAEERAWEVIGTAETDMPPLLKEMFMIAKSRYDTPWYGYLNADILITHTFLQTLEWITHKFNANIDRLLLIGRRINVEDYDVINPSSDVSVRDTAKTKGTLFREDAEDYFIASKVFPWQGVLPVVVGIPGYDNWLVAEARCNMNTTVIDVTATLEAVHQTTKKGGNTEGHSHSHVSYNFDVFKKANVTPNYIAGLTECAEYKTYRTFCDTVAIHRRVELGPKCKCKA